MNTKRLLTFIRGWLPQEPKLPENLLINSQKPVQSKLRLTNSLKIVYGLTLGFVVVYYLVNMLAWVWRGIFDKRPCITNAVDFARLLPY